MDLACQELENIMQTLGQPPVSYREAPVMMGPAANMSGCAVKRTRRLWVRFHVRFRSVGVRWLARTFADARPATFLQ